MKIDPRSTATQADLEEQFKLLIQIRDAVSAANNGVRTIRNVKAQVADRAKRAGNASLGAALVSRISAVEARAVLGAEPRRAGHAQLSDQAERPARLAVLWHRERRTAKPTAQQYEVFKLLNGQLDEQLKTLKSALDNDLPKLNAELAKGKLPAIVASTVEMP